VVGKMLREAWEVPGIAGLVIVVACMRLSISTFPQASCCLPVARAGRWPGAPQSILAYVAPVRRHHIAAAAGCNGRWVQELCKGLPIFYSSPVREVRHCATGAAAEAAALQCCCYVPPLQVVHCAS